MPYDQVPLVSGPSTAFPRTTSLAELKKPGPKGPRGLPGRTGQGVSLTADNTFEGKQTFDAPIVLGAVAESPAAVADRVVWWVEDDGEGALQLMVKFPTGDAQIIASMGDFDMTSLVECKPAELPITIGATLGACTAIDMRKYRGGRLLILTGDTLSSVTFYEGTNGATAANHKLCRDIPALDVDKDQSVELPPALFGVHSLVILGNVAGTAVVLAKT